MSAAGMAASRSSPGHERSGSQGNHLNPLGVSPPHSKGLFIEYSEYLPTPLTPAMAETPLGPRSSPRRRPARPAWGSTSSTTALPTQQRSRRCSRATSLTIRRRVTHAHAPRQARGVAGLATFQQADAREFDYSPFDVVVVTLIPAAHKILLPKVGFASGILCPIMTCSRQCIMLVPES